MLSRFIFFKIIAVSTLCFFSVGCCMRDPLCRGEVSSSKEEFWPGPKEKVCYWYQKVSAKETELKRVDLGSEPLDLYNIIDIALANQPDTAKSWAEARASAFALGAEKSALYPNVSLQESFSLTKQRFGPGSQGSVNSDGDVAFTPSGSGYFQTLVSDLLISYLVLDFGGRSADIEASRQALYASNWLHNRNIQRVLSEVMNSYYAFINAEALLEAKLQDVEDAKKSYESALAMQQVGVKTRADVLQAKSNMLEMQLQEQEVRGLVHTTLGKLASEMGLPADTKFQVVGLPDKLPIEPLAESVERLMFVAKERRPDYKASYAGLHQAEAYLASARSDAMPSLSANVDLEKDTIFNHRGLNGHSYSGSLLLNVPIYSGCLYAYNIRKAKAGVDVALATLKAKENDIYLEVVNAYYNYSTAIETVKYSNDLLESAEENYAVALGNYKEGVGTIIDLLAAQALLANARSEHVQARTDWVTALVEIAYSTGTIGENHDSVD